jgi:hypothetical protein
MGQFAPHLKTSARRLVREGEGLGIGVCVAMKHDTALETMAA